jgi:hypothetical protein
VPAARAITGCDTTSSFFGIGKQSILKALKETPDQFSDLSMMSNQAGIFTCGQFNAEPVQVAMTAF